MSSLQGPGQPPRDDAFSNLLVTNSLVAKTLTARTVELVDVVARSIDAVSITADDATVVNLAVGTVTAESVTADTATFSTIHADTVTADTATFGTIHADAMTADTATLGTVVAGTVSAATLSTTFATITALVATEATITILNGNGVSGTVLTSNGPSSAPTFQVPRSPDWIEMPFSLATIAGFTPSDGFTRTTTQWTVTSDEKKAPVTLGTAFWIVPITDRRPRTLVMLAGLQGGSTAISLIVSVNGFPVYNSVIPTGLNTSLVPITTSSFVPTGATDFVEFTFSPATGTFTWWIEMPTVVVV